MSTPLLNNCMGKKSIKNRYKRMAKSQEFLDAYSDKSLNIMLVEVAPQELKEARVAAYEYLIP